MHLININPKRGDAMTQPKTLRPVFSGETPEGDRIVLYKRGHEYHLLRPDGEIWALSPQSKLEWWTDFNSSCVHLKIQSSAWTGMANGSRQALMEEPSRP